MDFESEINDLNRRVGDLEGALNVIAGKLGSVHPEIVALSTATANRFDRVEEATGRISGQLEDVSNQVWSLRDDFPELLRSAIKAALRSTRY